VSHVPEGIVTEVLLGDGRWLDISTRVRRETGGIRINRERRGGRSIGTMNFTIEDPSGDFNDLNPLSPYYGLIGPNTQVRASLGPQARLLEDFNRSVSNGWTGGLFTWILSGGTVPDDYDINGAKGLHTHPATNVNHFSYADTGHDDHRVRTIVNLSAGAPTGATVTSRVHGRFTDTSNWYSAALTYATSGLVTMQFSKTVAGVGDVIGDAVTIGTFANLAATQIAIELYVEGNKLHANAWDYSTDPAGPAGWMLVEVDDDLPTGTNGGVSSRRTTGNTNANLVFAFDVAEMTSGTIRAHMEVPNLGALRWTPGGKDVTMAIQAADIKRRLGAPGGEALQSPMTRFVARQDPSPLVGYWSCETGQFTAEIGSITGGPSLNVVGSSITFGATSPFPGVASMVQLGTGASLFASSLPSADTGVIKGQILCKFPDDGIPDDTPIMQIITINDADVRKWYLRYQESTGGALAIVGYDHSFTLVENSGYIDFEMNGKAALIQWEVRQNGAGADWEIATHEIQVDGTVESLSSTNLFPSTSVGAPSGMSVAPTGAMDGCLVGGIGLMNTATALDGAEVALTGHIGETTTERFIRLCDEESITYQVLGDAESADSSLRMGPQRIATLLQNLEDCEDTEHGIMYGARHFFGLVFRTHETLLNQDDGPTFTYTDGYLTGEPFPDPNESLWGNDVTASRPSGSQYRSIEETGPMSVQDRPNGIGRYPRPVSANTAWDSQLPDVARWNRHIGTWQGPRYPTITFDTNRPVFNGAPGKAVDRLEVGDPFVIDEQPAWLAPEDISVLGQGYQEVILNLERTIIFNAVPAGPYQVAIRNAGWYRDSASSTMNSTAAAGATSLSVAVTGPLWTTGTVDFNILVYGSILHVTNISGASSPQTFTVDAVRVNGVDKELPAGQAVHVHPLPVRALADVSMNVTMHADATGTRVKGTDFPPAQWTPGESTGNFTSATYIEDTDAVGVVFTPPSTASFVVHLAGELDNDNASGQTFMSFIIRRGAVLGEGNVLIAADDTTAIMSDGTDQVRGSKAFLVDVTSDELPPGVPINITMAHRRGTAGNAVIRRRLLLVRPVRTQGGLPGSLIDEEQQAEDAAQDANDTSTSLTYTTADMASCGTAFVAGPTGKILVHVSARMDHSTDAPTRLSFEIREGNVVGSGAVFLAADDTRSVSNQNVNQLMLGITFPVTGLTAGADYNVQLLHRTTSGTLSLSIRNTYVEQVA
jgi:hypothetical protein